MRSQSRTVILLYHRISDVDLDPLEMCVSPQHFEEHLAVLRDFRLVSLPDAAPGQFRFSGPSQSVAVTFDDGYADHLQIALPLLERFEIPATFFITTGQIGRSGSFWWDELISLMNAADRDSTFRDLYALLRGLDEGAREQEMARLRQSAGRDSSRSNVRALTNEELYKLSRSPLAEIGAHSVTHPVLSMLPGPKQREEIGASKQFLEKLIGKKVMSFAYPFFRGSEFTSETEEYVIDGGFGLACTTEAALLERKHLCYRLPRLTVPDVDGDKFGAWLSGWFQGRVLA